MMIKTFNIEYTGKQLPIVDNNIEDSNNYGVLSLEMSDIKTTDVPILFHIMLDVSGSMSDIVSHNRTKMQLLKHTIVNMIHYFAENTENVYICVKGFDNNIHNYIEPILVSKSNIDILLDKISKIRPMQSTDIGLALETLQNDMSNEINEDKYNVGILLTDGHPTSGIMDINDLVNIVLQNKTYHFIALGNEHNGDLMNALGHYHSETRNWFINEIEHTGNVYGEIIFNETNRLSKNNIIHVENGTIYDYRKGCFDNQLNIGTLSREEKKEFHILANNKDTCNIFIEGIQIELNENYKKIANKTECNIGENSETNNIFITKHYLRLCVQLLLYNVRSDLEKIKTIDNCFTCFQLPIHQPKLKGNNKHISHAKNLKKIILEFTKENKLENDLFLTGLINDLHVLLNTSGHVDQYKHIASREDTQGRQCSYNTASQMEDDPNDFHDFHDIPIPTLSRNSTTAYTTPSRVKLMRDISNTNDETIITNALLPPSRLKGERLGTPTKHEELIDLEIPKTPLRRQITLSSKEELYLDSSPL